MTSRRCPKGPKAPAGQNIVRVLKENGRAGEEYRDAHTGNLLIAHQGNIRDRRDPAVARALLRRDLRVMYALAEQRGAGLILLTYTAFPLPGRSGTQVGTPHEYMNEELREFRRQHHVTLVDVRDRFIELLANRSPRSQFFLADGDDHPNPRGYVEVGRLVGDVFEEANGPDPVALEAGAGEENRHPGCDSERRR